MRGCRRELALDRRLRRRRRREELAGVLHRSQHGTPARNWCSGDLHDAAFAPRVVKSREGRELAEGIWADATPELVKTGARLDEPEKLLDKFAGGPLARVGQLRAEDLGLLLRGEGLEVVDEGVKFGGDGLDAEGWKPSFFVRSFDPPSPVALGGRMTCLGAFSWASSKHARGQPAGGSCQSLTWRGWVSCGDTDDRPGRQPQLVVPFGRVAQGRLDELRRVPHEVSHGGAHALGPGGYKASVQPATQTPDGSLGDAVALLRRLVQAVQDYRKRRPTRCMSTSILPHAECPTSDECTYVDWMYRRMGSRTHLAAAP